MFPVYPDLKNKHVLITGGSNGIGEALTRTFAQQASEVTILDLDKDKGLKIAKDCENLNCKVNVYSVDLTNTSELTKTLNLIKQETPIVDVLINNAGYDPRYPLLEMSEEEWNHLFQLNVVHYFITCRELLPDMIKAGGGSIIMTSSHVFWIAKPDMIAYNTTKAAVIGLVRSLATAAGKHHIRVNAVAPGWIMTERQLEQWVTPEAKQKTINELQSIPLELTPDELMGTYLFLASESSRAITRQTIVVDGGYAQS
ncbi:SDR family NAD(P)-dependent oxidoreductase [Aphanothece sacrum]|uniref:3-oxoacyl-ACP reductase n=1 Tax=Aphanothece sacrum FPU1 TaxID=1920663 RepID=A0A401IMI5_APHSA|nr:SDR family oxidoreductase [Aphanothece sacrum]GBF82480.1 3-oxoacyl-ACP reductase [Aphanothece sacrum FPU1]GBF84365.1 3-oxoacyl-ACP reductase [Aphanothece sacrum FPU3]